MYEGKPANFHLPRVLMRFRHVHVRGYGRGAKTKAVCQLPITGRGLCIQAFGIVLNRWRVGNRLADDMISGKNGEQVFSNGEADFWSCYST